MKDPAVLTISRKALVLRYGQALDVLEECRRGAVKTVQALDSAGKGGGVSAPHVRKSVKESMENLADYASYCLRWRDRKEAVPRRRKRRKTV